VTEVHRYSGPDTFWRTLRLSWRAGARTFRALRSGGVTMTVTAPDTAALTAMLATPDDIARRNP
jgi:hypothetical protein